jgi:hypothetical protein
MECGGKEEFMKLSKVDQDKNLVRVSSDLNSTNRLTNVQKDSKYRWSKIKKGGQRYSYMVENFGIGIFLALPRQELETDGVRISKWTHGLVGGLTESLEASADGEALREFCDVISEFMQPLLYGKLVPPDVCVARLQELEG